MRGKWSYALCILGLTTGVSLALQLLQTLVYAFAGVFTMDIQELMPAPTFQGMLRVFTPLLTSAALLLFQVLVSNPLSLGGTSFYWKNANQEDPQADTVLLWFQKGKYRRSVCAMFLMRLYQTLWGCACFGPAILAAGIMITVSEQLEYSDVLVIMSLFVIVVLTAGIGLYAFLRVIQRYFLVPYLLTSQEHLGALETIALSKAMMADRGRDALHFQFSFIGWFVLCLFILPVMYVFPYLQQACAEYALAIIELETRKREETRLRHEEMMRTFYNGGPSPYSSPAATGE